MDLLSSVIVEFGKCLWDPSMRHATYLLRYNQYVKKLETHARKLEEKRGDIQHAVDEAHQQGEAVYDDVQRWLDNADTMKFETGNMGARLADTKCWKGWCWNPVLCYGLGKEAAKKIAAVDELHSQSEFPRLSHRRSPPTTDSLLPTSGLQALASIKETMLSVLNALQDEKIQVIGVYGMGGVGKTTLMEMVAKQAEGVKLFDKVVMVTVSQKIMIEKIQTEIAEQLGLKFVEESIPVRASRILDRLKEIGKSLVILDGLWESIKLTDVGIPSGDVCNGCKIVITTRNSNVCNMMSSQKMIEVKTLSEDDSWYLFQENAGPMENSRELSNVAREVVRECKGLPFAIRELGLSLRDKSDVAVWNDVLQQLKRPGPTCIESMEKVFRSIKFSFDYLQSEEAKLCFLFCCLFPNDYNIEFRDVIWIMVGERQIKSVETLEQASPQSFAQPKVFGIAVGG